MTVTEQDVATDLPCLCGCPKWRHKQGRAVCKQCGCERYEPSPDAELAKLRAEVEQLNRAAAVIAAERDEAVLRASQAANTVASLRLRCEHLEREEVHARGLVDEAREQRNKAQAETDEAHAALDHGSIAYTNEVAQLTVELAETRANRDQVAASLDALWVALGVKTAADGDAMGAIRKLHRQLADAEAALVEANGARRLSNAEHLHQRISAAALVIGRFHDWRYCPMCREIGEPHVKAPHACGRLVAVDVLIARRPNQPTTEEKP